MVMPNQTSQSFPSGSPARLELCPRAATDKMFPCISGANRDVPLLAGTAATPSDLAVYRPASGVWFYAKQWRPLSGRCSLD